MPKDQTQHDTPIVRPPSATNGWIAVATAVGAILVMMWAISAKFPPLGVVVLTALAIIGPLAVTDLMLFKVYRRDSAGLGRSPVDRLPGHAQRVFIKLVGFAATLGSIAVLYWLFPEYDGKFYDPYFTLLTYTLPIMLIFAVPYFIVIDRMMTDPQDGYWHVGRLVLGHFPDNAEDRRRLREHLLGWLIKAFFLPLMTVYLYRNVSWMANNPIELAFAEPHTAIRWLINLGFFLDVSFAFVGYTMTLRVIDSHIRSSNPLLLGWFVALMCYKPFWSLFENSYLAYGKAPNWLGWLGDYPTLVVIWGGMLVILIAIYAWATVIFGLRFSNLTHRGIITGGPFRFTKHPAYVAKNLYWWMATVPFIAAAGWETAVQSTLLILGLNAIYIMRAKTEEKHLSSDSTYVQYCEWIQKYGIFARIKRIIHFK